MFDLKRVHEHFCPIGKRIQEIEMVNLINIVSFSGKHRFMTIIIKMILILIQKVIIFYQN